MIFLSFYKNLIKKSVNGNLLFFFLDNHKNPLGKKGRKEGNNGKKQAKEKEGEER